MSGSFLALLLMIGSATWLDVPFARQTVDGCGSASIWMVMAYWRPVGTPPVDEIHREVFSASVSGVYASEMERYFASKGFRIFPFVGQWEDLRDHLNEGHPLIVSLRGNAREIPLHYVVVAGFDESQGIVLINDAADRKLRAMNRSDFERRWKQAGNWTLLAIPPAGTGVPESKSKQTSEACCVSAPSDPTPELIAASNAFRKEDYASAKRYAHDALRKNPADLTANDLLATLYFLENNFEASLKYWNRIEKPLIRDVVVDPPLGLDPVRLDHAFAFSRANVLSLNEYRRTLRNLDASGVLSNYNFDLQPSDSGSFDLTFRAAERDGMSYLSALAGVPFQTVRPSVTNWGGREINAGAIVRWDSPKQRLWTSVSGPADLRSSTRWNWQADGRRERWDLDGNEFELRKVETSVVLEPMIGARGSWSSGALLGLNQHRKAVGYLGGIQYDLLRVPERRLMVKGEANIKVERLGEERFEKLDAKLGLRWLPRPTGSDFATSLGFRTGLETGEMPVDELFALGTDRDNPDFLLRGHPATNNGRKGASVFAQRFALLNAETEKAVADISLIHFGVAPFVDAAKTSNWFVDTGIEFRVRFASTLILSLSIGKDLRTGNTVVFAR